MKLSNKNTGVIREAEARDDGIYLYSAETEQWFKYDLPLLAEYWEYYVEPQEPQLEDEKTRKIVREWADVCGVKEVVFYSYGEESEFVAEEGTEASISFNYPLSLEENRTYTIPELCGEGEE